MTVLSWFHKSSFYTRSTNWFYPCRALRALVVQRAHARARRARARRDHVLYALSHSACSMHDDLAMASWCMARVLTCTRAQVKSRAYARARRTRARRDEYIAVLSARSSFSARTLVPDAPALNATTCSMRSRRHSACLMHDDLATHDSFATRHA